MPDKASVESHLAGKIDHLGTKLMKFEEREIEKHLGIGKIAA
jgi:hypothetical protein